MFTLLKMLGIEPVDLLVSWTPVAVVFVVLILVLIALAALLVYLNRVSVQAWFNARWVEQSSAHARTLAVWTTGYYVGSRLGIPGIEPVSGVVCLVGWARAVWQFLKPDGEPPAQGTNVVPVASIALIVTLGVSLSGCAGFDAAWSGANNYYSAEMKATQKNIQGVNDNAAATWADAGCAMPYGELVRNGSGNPNLPAAVVALCGAPSGFTMTHTVPTTQAIQVPTVQLPAQVPANSAPSAMPANPVSLNQPQIAPSIVDQAKAARQQMLVQVKAKSQ